MAMWNPWKGCHRCSDGCKYCYIHKGCAKRGENCDDIIPAKGFDTPLLKDKKGEYKIKSGDRIAQAVVFPVEGSGEYNGSYQEVEE